MRTVHIGIAKDAEIVDSNGHSVGKVHDIIYNEQQEVTAITVQRGLLFKHDVVIPHDAIDKVEDGKICLTVPVDALSQMMRPEASGETTEQVQDEVQVRSSTS